MWKIQHAHKWVMTPYTKYEKFRELRVRESRHSVMLFDERHFDVDSGKFVKDKMRTINSYSLNDIIDDSIHHNYDKRHYSSTYSHKPWFYPKDNDFDF